MSKSLGNLISPVQLFSPANAKSQPQGKDKAPPQGKGKAPPPKNLLDRTWPVDVCRLWVAASDFTNDMSLGLKQLLKVGTERARKE